MIHHLHVSRVGNIGSLSWFATVYLELHVGFTAAYGLTLGFMVVALIMLIFGKQCYGTANLSTYFMLQCADASSQNFS